MKVPDNQVNTQCYVCCNDKHCNTQPNIWIIIKIIMTSMCKNCISYKTIKIHIYNILCIYICFYTWSECGNDIRMMKRKSISDQECAYCGHQNCRSCRLNLKCNKHSVTACVNCINNNQWLDICNCLNYKLRFWQN